MKKVIGYVLVVVGALAMLLSYKQIQTSLKLTLPAGLTSNMMLYGGLIVLALGAVLSFMASKGNHRSPDEVPIYHGKHVVGYRRLHK